MINNLVDEITNYKHGDEPRIINMDLSQDILASSKTLTLFKLSKNTTPNEILDCLLCLFIKQVTKRIVGISDQSEN